MITQKKVCKKCQSEIGVNNFSRHVKVCDGTPKSRKFKSVRFDLSQFSCIFCKQELMMNGLGFFSHLRHCKPYRKSEGLGDYVDTLDGVRDWQKGLTKATHPGLAVTSQKISRLNEERNSADRLQQWHESATSQQKDERNKRQSETRKKKYLDGTLKIRGGRGKKSFIYINDKLIHLRSTYEFIFAIFLYSKGLTFGYETIRVRYNNKVYVCDFEIGDILYEVKGLGLRGSYGSYVGANINNITAAFESRGYTIDVIGHDVIHQLKCWMESDGWPVSRWIDLIFQYHREKRQGLRSSYFTMNLDTLCHN